MKGPFFKKLVDSPYFNETIKYDMSKITSCARKASDQVDDNNYER